MLKYIKIDYILNNFTDIRRISIFIVFAIYLFAKNFIGSVL